jgi:hypothetical protein
MAWSEAPSDALDIHRVVLGIDAPLGFPIAFARLLCGGEAPGFRPDAPEIENPLAYRDCDRHIHYTLGKKPLSASFDKLGNNATVAMHHARRLARLHGDHIVPFDSPDDGSHIFIEVYPALCKQPNEQGCYAPIGHLLPGDAIPGSNSCDACICALTALAFIDGAGPTQLPRLNAPLPHLMESAKVEGWMYHFAPESLNVATRHHGVIALA